MLTCYSKCGVCMGVQSCIHNLQFFYVNGCNVCHQLRVHTHICPFYIRGSKRSIQKYENSGGCNIKNQSYKNFGWAFLWNVAHLTQGLTLFVSWCEQNRIVLEIRLHLNKYFLVKMICSIDDFTTSCCYSFVMHTRWWILCLNSCIIGHLQLISQWTGFNITYDQVIKHMSTNKINYIHQQNLRIRKEVKLVKNND